MEACYDLSELISLSPRSGRQPRSPVQAASEDRSSSEGESALQRRFSMGCSLSNVDTVNINITSHVDTVNTYRYDF